jgi:tetratricopeptide (TPR) repeat protein
VSDYFLAYTAWSRATILFEMGRYAEAHVWAASAATTLRTFGAELQEQQVRLLVGCIQYELGEIGEAIRTFAQLLESLRRADDQLSVARVLSNLGFCHLAAFDEEAAQRCTAEAVALFRRLGVDIEVIRTRCAVGRAYLRRGDSGRGIIFLTEIAAQFRSRQLHVDAAEVDLDIIEEHLKHQRYDIAADMARNLVTVFTAAESRISAAKALAYLAEAAAGMRATAELVRHVRHVITHPEQEFHLPATDLM